MRLEQRLALRHRSLTAYKECFWCEPTITNSVVSVWLKIEIARVSALATQGSHCEYKTLTPGLNSYPPELER